MNEPVKLEEKSWTEECYLLKEDESLTPIFCKPKLIPLKTITTQKIEKVQKEQKEKLEALEKKKESSNEVTEEDKLVKQLSAAKIREPDIWTASV
uniref:Dynein assembly factor 4, axonemal n=1 Tax=Caenorhabditis tropicalis TaxID=1561998 RepID=A0A1I7TLE7_9PELO